MGDGTEAGRYLIVDPAFVGDTVFDGVLVSEIRRREPKATIGMVVRPPSDSVARRILGLDRVHLFDKRGEDRGLGGLVRRARELRIERYEVALIPHPSLRSALLSRLAAIPRRVGFAGQAGSFLFTERVERLGPFVPDRLRLLGLEGPDRSRSSLAGTLAGAVPRERGGRFRLGLVLGSEWETKRWAPSQAEGLIRLLDPRRVELVLLGAEWERALYRELLERRPAGLEIVDAIGGTVEALIDRIGSCDVVLGGDTGPVHLARGLGKPVVILFGPTSARSHLFEARDQPVELEQLDCRPCSAHGPRKCPLDHHRCMRDISAERVHLALNAVLDGLEEGEASG